MLTPGDAETKRVERIARQEREARKQSESDRNRVSIALLGVGVLLIAVGLWFLLVNPGESSFGGQSLVSLHRLTLGETSAIAGAILFAAGALIRYR
jgi:type II secretory pathway component PulM